MQGIQISNPLLTNDGPIIDAEIFSNDDSFYSVKNFNGYDVYCKVKLLIDTGSNISGLDTKFVKQLKLRKQKGKNQVNGVGGMYSANLFRAILFIPIFKDRALPINIIEGNYTNMAYDGVIGRDVLEFCSFVYDGWSNTFKLIAIDV
jgi:Aspartyl protease